MNYNPELISFRSTDSIKLPGLLYKTPQPTKKVAIYLHGNGSTSIFYKAELMNSCAVALAKLNIAFFPFNNRGAHYIKSLRQKINGVDERIKLGTTYERIKDCIQDIDGAIAFLKIKGYTEFYLIGASTGANKIVVYDKYKPYNEVSKYILLSGGDDTGLYYQQMGRKLFYTALKRAKAETEKGNGTKFVPKSIVNYLFSWQALYDTINPDSDYNIFPFNEWMNNLKLSKKALFGEYRNIKKPTLVVYGELDEYCYDNVSQCVSILKEYTQDKPNFSYQIIPGADHGFSEHEQELADLIAKWLE